MVLRPRYHTIVSSVEPEVKERGKESAAAAAAAAVVVVSIVGDLSSPSRVRETTLCMFVSKFEERVRFVLAFSGEHSFLCVFGSQLSSCVFFSLYSLLQIPSNDIFIPRLPLPELFIHSLIYCHARC